MSGTRSIESRQLYRAVPDAVTELGRKKMIPRVKKAVPTRGKVGMFSSAPECIREADRAEAEARGRSKWKVMAAQRSHRRLSGSASMAGNRPNPQNHSPGIC